MRILPLLVALFCGSLFSSGQEKTPETPSQRECAAHEKHVQMMGLDAAYAKHHNDLEAHTALFVESRQTARANGAQLQPVVVTIPVVFHVVYANETENISDEQLLEQLQVLNDDFRRTNADQDDIWPQAADTEIEFCLATRDPNGAPSDGILRVPTTSGSFGTSDNVKFTSAGGSDAWPTADYMNFWVCNLGGGLLGYAQFPGGNPATDGIVCGYQFVGIDGPGSGAYNLGRTATHEVGHWLNLRHIWGDGACGADDFVADTPESDGANFGCALGHISCSTEDMVQNYMDYSDDGCMNVFSLGQADRMQALLAPGGTRASLLSSNGCLPAVPDFDLDAAIIGIDSPSGFSCATEVTPSLTLFNYGGDTLTNATLTYVLDDGLDMTYSWTGSLAFGESVGVVLPNLTPGDGAHTFSVSVSAPNGGVDGNSTNDSATSAFSLDAQGVDVVMTLNLDNYPGETTWDLVNADGDIVWSGGPYGGAGSTQVETSCVGDGCYTLTVYDSFGDGMCCAYGTGSYEFSQDGAVLASGGDFTNSASSEVCVGDIVLGCTDSGACNYNPDAVADDGSCDFSCFGCLDDTFCNYNPDATVDDGSCANEDICGICAGNGSSCTGCTDSTACNYNPDATFDDGSCFFAPVGGICDCSSEISITETLGGGAAGTPATFTGTGEVSALDIVLDYTTSAGSWAADMLVVVTSPNGDCIEFGGFSATVSAGCTDLGNYTLWPEVWTEGTDGTYTASLDLSAAGLTGAGEWSVQLVNGYASSGAVTYVADITIQDVCIGGVIDGCTDPAACNYNPDASTDDGSCADNDLCGVCAGDNSTCGGCTDSTACNYDPSVIIDDGSCLTLDQCGECGGDDSSCGGCTDSTACNFDPSAILDDGTCLADGLPFLLTIVLDNYPQEVTWALTDSLGATVNSGGPYTSGESVITESFCAGDGCYTFSIFDSFGDGICCNFGLGDYALTVDGIIVASGGEYGDVESTSFCVGTGFGCTDATACNYDEDAVNESGGCDFSCYGCTDPLSCNYDDSATIDDGSCIVDGVPVTISIVTDIYPGEITWTFSDSSGTVIAAGGPYNSSGSTEEAFFCVAEGCYTFTILDSFGDGIYAPGGYTVLVDGVVIASGGDYGNVESVTFCTDNLDFGCTDPDACNYDDQAGIDNGSCEYGCLGCTLAAACNYDPEATVDDGTCLFDDECGVCGGDGTSCDGCTDPEACNYNPSAAEDDGSCTYAATGLDCNGDCLNDADNDGICDEDEVAVSSFVQLGYDVVGQNTVNGMTTYRVWAEFSDLTEQLVAIYGFDSIPMSVESSTGFYQNPLGGALASNYNPALLPVDPLIEFDSWLTVGGQDNSADVNTIGLDFGAFEGSGGAVLANDVNGGSVFIYPDLEPTAFPNANGQVLIAQLTTDGEVSLTVNLQTRTSDGENPQILQESITFQEVSVCFGDLNFDGIIGIGDLLMMLGEFGCAENCSHDLNDDGGVTTSDMLIMLSLFGTDCPE
jgi:hypothetical protein